MTKNRKTSKISTQSIIKFAIILYFKNLFISEIYIFKYFRIILIIFIK